LLDANKLNNYGAARLENGTIIVGRSSAQWHAEEELIARAGARKITDLYTELEPCARKCAALTGGMNATWSWAWNDVDRAASQFAKREAIRRLFGL